MEGGNTLKNFNFIVDEILEISPAYNTTEKGLNEKVINDRTFEDHSVGGGVSPYSRSPHRSPWRQGIGTVPGNIPVESSNNSYYLGSSGNMLSSQGNIQSQASAFGITSLNQGTLPPNPCFPSRAPLYPPSCNIFYIYIYIYSVWSWENEGRRGKGYGKQERVPSTARIKVRYNIYIVN